VSFLGEFTVEQKNSLFREFYVLGLLFFTYLRVFLGLTHDLTDVNRAL